MLVKDNATKHPLQPAYRGPYKIAKHTEKHFEVVINNKQGNISINQLKLAYVENIGDNSLETTK